MDYMLQLLSPASLIYQKYDPQTNSYILLGYQKYGPQTGQQYLQLSDHERSASRSVNQNLTLSIVHNDPFC